MSRKLMMLAIAAIMITGAGCSNHESKIEDIPKEIKEIAKNNSGEQNIREMLHKCTEDKKYIEFEFNTATYTSNSDYDTLNGTYIADDKHIEIISKDKSEITADIKGAVEKAFNSFHVDKTEINEAQGKKICSIDFIDDTQSLNKMNIEVDIQNNTIQYLELNTVTGNCAESESYYTIELYNFKYDNRDSTTEIKE